ncbi:MAG: hypothetical protein EBS55_14125 [Flavobacteriaceae bacterium]|nr:hypothetical protein [Flavobacteriaceae bacterium]
MDNTIYEYIKHGITIEGNPIDGYKVFTIPTQWFHIDSLHQLTPQVFEEMIEEQKEKEELVIKMFNEVSDETGIEIDWRGYLEGKHVNPIYDLFNKFLNTPDPDVDPDLIWNKEQFVNMLLTDDDFYQKWGENCCEELTYEERYKLWFGNNFETGMEYNPSIEPYWDNDYYEPTPKRKLK